MIDRLLADAGNLRSGALVVRGEVGVGKSALLAYAADRAAGKMRVLWGFGVESESELAFAGLHQLARPVLHHVERLPGPQAAALRGAFGLATAHGDDRFLIGVGALSLLAEGAGPPGAALGPAARGAGNRVRHRSGAGAGPVPGRPGHLEPAC